MLFFTSRETSELETIQELFVSRVRRQHIFLLPNSGERPHVIHEYILFLLFFFFTFIIFVLYNESE